MATIVTHPRQVQIDYGVIETNAAGELAGYREKPTIDYSVSTGMYILNREALDYMPPTGKFDMPELMLALIAAGHRVGCRPTDCYWQDIGRFEDYQRASEDYVANPSRFHPERAQNA
jgi:NDP-sugar pyrophosphorylase family protein